MYMEDTGESAYTRYIALERFDDYVSAHIALGRLEEDGINCWLKDENTVTIDPILTNAVGGIKLMVLEQQAGRASEILAQIAAEYKASQACPKCNSHNIMLVTSPRKLSNWISALAGTILGNFAMGIRKNYKCFDCQAEFEEAVSVDRDGGQESPAV